MGENQKYGGGSMVGRCVDGATGKGVGKRVGYGV